MKTSINTRIKFSDTDNQSLIRFGSIIDMMQDCMNYQSESLGAGVDYQRRTKRAWLLSSWQIEIRGSFGYNEEVIVSTWPYSFKGVCGRRNSVIARAAGGRENVILANSVWAMYDVAKGMLSKITEEDTAPYECEAPLDMNYRKGKIVRFDSYEAGEAFVVRKYQLDFNNHMNNGWYVKLAEEFLGDRTRVTGLRAEYKKPALYGDVIVPYIAEENQRMVVELRSRENELYAIIEFEYR